MDADLRRKFHSLGILPEREFFSSEFSLGFHKYRAQIVFAKKSQTIVISC